MLRIEKAIKVLQEALGLQDLTLHIAPEYGLLGPNGAGKRRHIICNLLKADSGDRNQQPTRL